MLLPRKWALGLGLLAAVPGLTVAGPLDFLMGSQDKPESAAHAPDHENQAVADEIGKALSQAHLSYKDVQIEVLSGTATIKGEIRDASQRALVTRIASQIPGVKSIENQLTIMEPANPSQTSAVPAGAPSDSAAVHEAAAVQHAAHEGLPSRRVQQVNFDAARQAPSNQEVAQHIAEALTSAGLSGYDIEVRYKAGVASLVGTVDDREQVSRAQMATQQVPGVQQVLNRLSVKGSAPMVQPTAGYAPQGMPQQAYGMPPAGMPPSSGYPTPPGYPSAPRGYGPPPGYPGAPQGSPVQQAQGMMPPAPAAPAGPMPQYGNVQPAGHHIYNQPNVPSYAWPTYAPYDNSAAITYPTQYDASAFPYIGPYYPYPQVPLGWRQSTLEWDDGYWSLKFDNRTNHWWWFLNPHNWHSNVR
jgi:osmotically-inducible protein OsmY